MKINVNHTTLNYQKRGNGKPLVMLHGNGENYHIFDVLAKKLEAYFTIYLIDSRGHGESARHNAYHYDDMAGDVSAFLDAFKLEDVTLLGFSDGGIIALLVGIEQHNALGRLIVCGANMSPSDFFQEAYQEIVEEYQSTKDVRLKMMLDEPNITSEMLENIQVPTLVVSGENDVFPQNVFLKMKAHIDNSEYKMFKQHDHGSYVVESDLLFDDVISFIKRSDNVESD